MDYSKKCKHYPLLGYDNTLEYISSEGRGLGNYYIKRCKICGKVFKLKRFKGKIDAYNIKVKWYRDWMRDKHRKELIQPLDKHGKFNPEFEKAYGYNPFKEEAPKIKERQREGSVKKDRLQQLIEREQTKKAEEKVLKEIKPFKS